jgi:iron-sulfur cluster repair protein YtfE (RIC family)
MKKSIYLQRFGAIAVAVLVITLSAPTAVHAQTSKHSEPHRHDSKIQIPEAMRLEHMEIHDGLVRATKMPGQVGDAARKLAAVLDPHFVREEQIALPPLGLLAPLSRGEFTPEMREVLSMTDALRVELPRMLSEHKAIRAATVRLGEVAKAAGDATVERLAETLKVHAQSEEEVFYPAALLVGDVVSARSATETNQR